MMPFLARSLQAFGLVVVPAGLLYGISFHSMSGELGLLLIGVVSFVIGRSLDRGATGEG